MNEMPNSVETALVEELAALQARAMRAWAGREAEGLIMLVRALDGVAIASKLGVNEDTNVPIRRLNARYFIRIGAASALRPFLAAVRDRRDGVPWARMQKKESDEGFAYLTACGQIAHLLRMSRLERYGLAKTGWSEQAARVDVPHSIPEIALHYAMANSRLKAQASKRPFTPNRGWPRLRHRMRQYVATDPVWFIRYENDLEIVEAFRNAAIDYGADFFEAEALTDDAYIGDRTYAEWKLACHQALGRILCHVEFCRLLRFKEPKLGLGNLATIFARREDVEAVWRQAGLLPERVEATMSALSLSIENVGEWEQAFELPCHFYVDLGRDFVLLPCFGALSNPYVALFRHLRSVYKTDWDRSVDRRELVFRADLSSVFRTPRFHIPTHGFKLRRADRSLITDLDAVIVDKATGSVALIQLKWHDLFGHSLSERESRRRNLLHANRWVSQVTEWAGGRSSTEICAELGIDSPPCNAPPLLFVVTRYAARFTGERDQDARAAWMSWFEIVHLFDSLESNDPLRDLPHRVQAHEDTMREPKAMSERFKFSSLTVDLTVNP